ncbi:uncharacterized protein LOC143920253 [Arctopsyche grandis]|uniref:uncharacterized protein LOC143920253 n=1 Tax=Arctopsyche grandis TaxID=121162 RepID=UPI00406D871B
MTFFVILLLAVLGVARGNIFMLQEEVEYDYKALVQASVQKPSFYTSEYLINAKIYVTGITDGVLVKLLDVTHTVYSGIGDGWRESNKLPIKSDAESITKPFVIHYDRNGKIVEVLTDINDNLWSVNIKRAISSLLQIDLNKLDSSKVKPYGFYSKEQTVYGNCQVLYTVDPKTQKNNIITKHHTASSCQTFEWDLNIDANSNKCEDNQEEPITHSSERYYDIEIKNKDIIINHIEGFNSILFTPFNANSDTHTILINQTLHKLSNKKLANHVEVDKQNMQKNGISTEFFEQNKIYDLTGRRQIFNKEIIMSKMRMALEKVHTYLKTSHVRLSDNTYEQHGNVNYLLRQLRYMDEDCLKHCYEKIADFKHEEDSEIMDIFLKLLPHAGTYASTTFICNLIKEHKVKDDIAVKMIQDIPYYIKYPDKTILKKLYELTLDSKNISEEVKQTAVIMFASMISKVMHYHSQDDVELQTYIDHYIQTLQETDNYNKQVLYLNALRNIDNGKVMKYLELVVRNSTGAMLEITPHLRVLAMWAAQQGHLKHPKRIENIYWPILMSRKDNLEVRATALQIIMSAATMNDHMKLYWYMISETDQELYNTYYTTLKSLSKATVSCDRLRAHNAKKILEFVKEPKITNTLSANHLVDYFDPNFGLGLTNRATSIGSLTNLNFMSFFAQWSPQISNMMFNQLSMYVHVKINKPFMKSFFAITSAEDLSNLLNSQLMNDLSIEVVWLKYDRVVSVSQYNLDSIKILWNNRGNILKKYSKTTSYQIEQIVNGEVIIPTDIGVPVILYVEMPTIKKTKYSFDLVMSQYKRALTTKIRYDTVWWYHQRYGMSVYNPIADLWHGSRRIHVLDAHIPFDTDISYNLEQKSLKASLHHKLQDNLTDSGFQSHVHSQVYIYNDNGNDELEKMCPTCKPVTIVTKGKEHRKKKIIWESDNENTGLNCQYAVFDCERDVSPIRLDYWKKIFTSNENSYTEEYPFFKTLIALKHWHEYLIVSPESGMCGLGFKYTPSSTHQATHSDISIHTSIEDTDNENKKVNLKTTYNIRKGDKLMKSWDINIVSEIVGTKVSNINIHLTSSKPDMENDNICIEGKQTIENENITGNWIFYASNSVDNKCVKNQTILQVSMKGERSEEQMMSKSLESNIYKECKEKQGFNSYKCESALTSLRHYTYDIRYEKLPQDYYKIYETITDLLKYMYSDYYVRIYPTGEKITSGNIRLIVDHPIKSEDVNISVITPTESYRYEMVPLSNLYWIGLVQPYSYQASTVDPILDKIGLTNKCEIGLEDITNVHNSHIPYKIPNEWTRLAADCNESCKWEISVKRLNDTLAIRIKYQDDILEIRSLVGYQIILNGKTLSHLATGYYNGPWFNYKVLGHEHKLVLQIQRMVIQIYHDGSTIKFDLQNKQYTGLCYEVFDSVNNLN